MIEIGACDAFQSLFMFLSIFAINEFLMSSFNLFYKRNKNKQNGDAPINYTSILSQKANKLLHYKCLII